MGNLHLSQIQDIQGGDAWKVDSSGDFNKTTEKKKTRRARGPTMVIKLRTKQTLFDIKVLVHIYGFLPIQSLAACSRVCKLFNQVQRSNPKIWSKLYMESAIAPTTVDSLKDSKDWKSKCLNYVAVKNKVIGAAKLTDSAKNAYHIIIEGLSDENAMKETYLAVSKKETVDMYNKLTKIETNIKDDMLMKDKDWPETFYQELVGHGVKVKLVVLESSYNDNKNPLNVYSPILQNFGSTFTSIGEIFVAVIIGPWLLIWDNTNSLVVPKKLVGNAYQFSRFFHRVCELNRSIDSVRDELASFLVKWNSTKRFHLKSCNSQIFVESLLNHFGIKEYVKPHSAFGQLIFELKNNGRTTMKFDMSRNLDYYAPVMQKVGKAKAQFKTHQDLDNFIHILFNLDPMFSVKHHVDYSLLIYFDLIFWAKHLMYRNDNKFQPLVIDKQRKCPVDSDSAAFL